MNQTARDFLIGLCSIVAFIGFGVLLMRFGEINTTSRYQVTIPTVEAAGLRAGSMVTFNGVKVGLVESTTPSGDPLWPVTIVIGVDEGHTIPSNAIPYSSSSLLGTGGTLALQVEPSERSAEPIPTDGTAILMGPVRSLMLTRLNDALDERLEPILGSVETLSSTYTELGVELLALVGPGGDEEDTLLSTLARVNGAIELAEAWLGDEELREEAHDLLGTSVIFVNHGIDMVEQLTALTKNIDTRSEDLLQQFGPVSAELTRLLQTTDRVMTAVEEGEGTIGQLVNNPDLYKSLEASMLQLHEAIVQFNLLVEQIREEGFF
ncbi:MAG: hypothetical protein CMJ36_02090 [Phycisphaerae bacterium]|nr:hypothetical protein [Phycisphaerae bacterium]